MDALKEHPAGEIVPLEPAEYSRCGVIWDMEKNREQARRWYQELLEGNRSVFIFRRNGPDYTVAGRRAYLSRLIVRPEYRRQGLGGRLVDFLAEKAREEGFTELSLGVDDANTAALCLYRKKGFTRVLYEGEDQYGKYKKLLKIL